MDDGAQAAFEAELALLIPEWVEQIKREAAGPAPNGERLRMERKAAEEVLADALALIDDAGNCTAVWIAARAQRVDLIDAGAKLRALLAGLRDLAAQDRKRGRPPRVARALALGDMADMWRRHGLGTGDAQDKAFVTRAVRLYGMGFGRNHKETRASDLRDSVLADLAIIAREEWQAE